MDCSILINLKRSTLLGKNWADGKNFDIYNHLVDFRTIYLSFLGRYPSLCQKRIRHQDVEAMAFKIILLAGCRILQSRIHSDYGLSTKMDTGLDLLTTKGQAQHPMG